jgi:hypothetical protein
MKTAVEWFFEQIMYADLDIKVWREIYDQAKKMEFEQRKKDFVNGYKSRAKESNLIFDETSEKYAIYLFNKTFKSE